MAQDTEDQRMFEDSPKKTNSKSKTPSLDNFGTDLTKMAKEGKLDQVIGREDEINRVIQILSRKKKNNPVLVGEPGVGKTAIVEGLAKKIVERKVSVVLHDKRIVALDLSSIVAGTKYRGQFEERMKAIMEEIEMNPDVIVFVDELHTIMGAGNAAGALDVSNMIKPALSRGVMQMIGATTIEEYKKSIEKDGAMERRFQKIMINPPSMEETRMILENIKDGYEFHHHVKFTPEALDAAVTFADRYMTTRFFPDKAIDIVDEVGSKTHIDNLRPPEKLLGLQQDLQDIEVTKKKSVQSQKYEEAAAARDKEKQILNEIEIVKKIWEKEEKTKEAVIVKEEDVAAVVSKMIGIPVTKITEDEGLKLMKMPDVLKEKIVGQDEAVIKVSEAIQRNRAGINNPSRPIASFLFLGFTGVGKTELSKALAEYIFNDPECLIKIDMSEYMEQHSVSRMIGSPPGYVGHDEGGQLTEKVRNKPNAVVLFDEIEKAHKDVLNVLLQVLDEGKLTDGLGRVINFKNTIVIMTSNLGTKELVDNKPVGFTQNETVDNYNIIMKTLKKHFRPEFLNRVDEQVVFNKLTETDIHSIAKIHIDSFLKRVKKQGYNIEATENIINFIAKEGFSEEFGARPILRAITMYLQNPISKEILLKSIIPGDHAVIDITDGEKNITVTKKNKK
jgi:ATP-dependent Clp protease ATP-binding subunit ClpC